MKTKKIILSLSSIFVFSIGVFLYSCKKDKETNVEVPLATVVVEETQASAINEDVDNEVGHYLRALESNNYNTSKSALAETALCNASVSVSNSVVGVWPKIITIDFGTDGCTGKRGNTITGKLQVTLSGLFATAGSYYTVSFVNFTVNGNTVKGTKIVTYKGKNTKEQDYWEITAKDTVIRQDGSKTIWQSARTRTLIGDNGTPNIRYDDFYSINGSASGINSKNESYNVNIDASNPLIIGNCQYIRSGVLTYLSGDFSLSVDYGNQADCDANATATFAGKTYDITLRN